MEAAAGGGGVLSFIVYVPGGTNFFWLPSPHGFTWRNPVRVASPHRIMSTWRNPVRVASPHRINLEEPGQGGQPT